MQPTPYPHVNTLLDHIRTGLQTILGDKLVGLYLYGSLVTGDFDPTLSDVDLLAVIASDLTPTEFEALDQFHQAIIADDPQWTERIEIAHLTVAALKMYRTHASQIAIISPGEPFHFKEAGYDWMLNWYIVREKGLTLFGQPPQSVIEPISKTDYIDVVKKQLGGWWEWIDHADHLGFQAYVILTMCRGLYTIENGEQVSKRQAALWAAEQLPEWAGLIHNALMWRQGRDTDSVDLDVARADTKRFVRYVIERVKGSL